jgi:hypothetical protein
MIAPGAFAIGSPFPYLRVILVVLPHVVVLLIRGLIRLGSRREGVSVGAKSVQ